MKVGSNVKHYIGQTANTFKTRWNGHKSDTRCGRSRTGLNSYMIELKRRGVFPDEIRWSKIAGSRPRKRGSRICSLCNDEKVFIATNYDENSLNDRSEMMSRCRHLDGLMLSNCYRARRTVPDPIAEVEVQNDPPEQTDPIAEVELQNESTEASVATDDGDPHINEGGTGSQESGEQRSSRGRKRAEVSYRKFF